MRAAGVSDQDIPAEAADSLGDVSPADIRAVMAEMDPAYNPDADSALAGERFADELAAHIVLVQRDEQLAYFLSSALRAHIDELGDPLELDPGSESRTKLRRLRDLDEALQRALGAKRGRRT
jgi:hypothetical protein